MLRRSSLLLALVVALTGCSAGKKVRVKSADIDPSLANISITGEKNPLDEEATKVEYLQVDMANYDQFFRDAALVEGAMVLADALTKELATSLTAIAQGQGITVPADAADWAAIAKQLVEKKGALKSEELEALKAHAKRVSLLAPVVSSIGDRAKSLAGTATTLVGSAKSDFVGANATKLPSVVDGLNKAKDNVASAAERAPAIASTLTSLVEALTAFAG